MIFKSIFTFIIVLLSGASPLLQAAYIDSHDTKMKKKEVKQKARSQKYSPLFVEWGMGKTSGSSTRDDWKYDLGSPQYLTGETEVTYYSMGLWKPKDEDPSISDASIEDWLLDHGVNFSFSTKTSLTDVRYRVDMRWHEDTDTEFLFQLQWPFK